MANKKILTVEEQKHLLSTLPEIFQSLTQAEVRDIIVKLGLQDLLDEDGNLITVYTLDINSNKPTYIISDYNIIIRGNAYNKGILANDEVTSWRWERVSGVPSEDTAWAQGKNTQQLTLSENDFTSRINIQDIVFKVYATIKNTEYSDEITYSKSQVFNKIQIKASHDLFLENSPASILVDTVEEGIFSDYRWYLGENFITSSKSFNLLVNSIPLRGSAVLKVEAKDSTGKTHSDTKTIPRISNGLNGESGIPGQQGPPGINGTSGPTPRLLEFVQGASYENGGLYIDYAYYRSNDVNEGWYTVKLPIGHTSGTTVSQVYAGGIPDNTKFNKAPFTKEMSFGTVVAEQANLAGFIFRNQVLNSQAVGTTSSCHPTPGVQLPNLSLDGLQGIIRFLDRMILDRNGIALKDDCGRPRMVFQWNSTTGVPILKFLDQNGATTWEAGQNGYQVVFMDIVPESYTPISAIYKSTAPNGSISEFNSVFNNRVCQVNNQPTATGNMIYFDQPGPPPENVVGYLYNKGVNPTYTTLQNTTNGKIFATQNNTGAFIPNGYYMRNFYATIDNSSGTPTDIVKAQWVQIVDGIEHTPFEVIYDANLSMPLCTPQQQAQWEAGF